MKPCEEFFDFTDVDPSHELYSEHKKVIGKIKLETTADLDLDEATCIRSKSFFFLIIKQNSSHCKHERIQDHITYTLE